MYSADRYKTNSLRFYSHYAYFFLCWVLANISVFPHVIYLSESFLEKKTEMLKLFRLIQGRY